MTFSMERISVPSKFNLLVYRLIIYKSQSKIPRLSLMKFGTPVKFS